MSSNFKNAAHFAETMQKEEIIKKKDALKVLMYIQNQIFNLIPAMKTECEMIEEKEKDKKLINICADVQKIQKTLCTYLRKTMAIKKGEHMNETMDKYIREICFQYLCIKNIYDEIIKNKKKHSM